MKFYLIYLKFNTYLPQEEKIFPEEEQQKNCP